MNSELKTKTYFFLRELLDFEIILRILKILKLCYSIFVLIPIYEFNIKVCICILKSICKSVSFHYKPYLSFFTSIVCSVLWVEHREICDGTLFVVWTKDSFHYIRIRCWWEFFIFLFFFLQYLIDYVEFIYFMQLIDT